MIWLQAIVCFGIWIGYGVAQSRRSASIRSKVGGIPRNRRATMGAVTMIVGAAILLGTFLLGQVIGGFTQNGMTPLTWLLIAAGGLAFVHGQTMAMAMLISLVDESVTSTMSVSSDQESPDVASK